MISWNDFEKIEMRIGTIIQAHEFPEAKKPAYQISIDFGPELGVKKTSAQITKLYDVNDLPGKQVVAVVNFPKKQIGKFMSECLLLGVIGTDKEVVLLTTDQPTQNGLRVG